MSKQNQKGTWSIPAKQIKEFFAPGGPDYNQLFRDCLETKLGMADEKQPKPRKGT